MNKNNVISAIEAESEALDKLVCHTPIANDHILHELEARYGEIVAWWINERLPKKKAGQ